MKEFRKQVVIHLKFPRLIHKSYCNSQWENINDQISNNKPKIDHLKNMQKYTVQFDVESM